MAHLINMLEEFRRTYETPMDVSWEVEDDETVLGVVVGEEILFLHTFRISLIEEYLLYYHKICKRYPIGCLGIPKNVPMEIWNTYEQMLYRAEGARFMLQQELREIFGPYPCLEIRKGFQVVTWSDEVASESVGIEDFAREDDDGSGDGGEEMEMVLFF